MMDFFSIRRFKKATKPDPDGGTEDKPVPAPEEPLNEHDNVAGKSVAADPSPDVDDEDDDFIANEVKRRLKELRRNSFMMLIPEESPLEDDEHEEGETSSSEGRGDLESLVQHAYYDYESIYDKYCERMLLFDRLSAPRLNEAGPISPSPSPRSASKKLTTSFQCLTLKKMDDDIEHLQQPDNGPYEDLETAYVGHLCLVWEALHCQYSQLIQRISCQPDNPTCYNHSAQQYQQFQVLLQRFIENEPFTDGLRPEVYARSRHSLPKLLQVPKVQGSYETVEEEDADFVVLAPDLLGLIENSILTFHVFLKRDKRKASGVRNLFANQNQVATSLHQVQLTVEKKQLKLKELRKKKKKGAKKNLWPKTHEEVDLLLGLIDTRVVARVLRMVRVSREQLLWCEDKMRKLDLTEGKLQRDPSPILFPCGD